MVTVSGKIVEVILIVLVFLFVLGIMMPVITWSINEDFRCKVSVMLTANNIGPGLSCDTDHVEPTERELARENGAARIVAEEMLECKVLFNAGSDQTILDYGALSLRIGSGVDSPITFGGRLARGLPFSDNYCFICSTIEFDHSSSIDQFGSYLTSEGIGDQTFYSLIYGDNQYAERYTRYINEDDDLKGPVWVIYSEGTDRLLGGNAGVSSGVTVLDWENLVNQDYFSYLCGTSIEAVS